jgi:RNA polymerase sigma-70 factor (ECF subfamily)
LLQINHSPIVAFNRAIALGYSEGAKAGIEALLRIENMDKNYLYHTALGDFYKKNKQPKDAVQRYEKALDLVTLPAERKVLEDKMRL